jgi:methionyl-tRNA formyltransferase
MDERILILCSDDAHHKYLVRALSEKFNVVGVVVEPYSAQVKRRLQKKQYANYFYMRYHSLRRRLVGYTQYRNSFFTTEESHKSLPTIEVSNINDKGVKALAEEVKPNIVVVMGTSIIGRKTLAVLGKTVINVHGGYLPDYKGNFCFFFALYNRDYAKIATTIHFVNTGIDTGDIIERVHPQLEAGDNAETLYCKAEMKAIHRLVELLEDYKCGNDFPRVKQEPVGKTYSTRDRKLFHEFFMLIKKPKIRKELASYE